MTDSKNMYNMFNIDDYDVFIFDFDGTIINTEPYHFKAYLKSFQDLGVDFNFDLDFQKYCKMLHNIDRTEFNSVLNKYTIDYVKLYEQKSKNFLELIKNDFEQKINKFIGNCDVFLKKLKARNKELVMVTNSSIVSINNFKKFVPELELFDKIYTKEDFVKKKPDPECYLKVQEIYASQNKRMIAFEDSFQGFHALSFATQMKQMFIDPYNYYYSEFIKGHYENVNFIKSYDCFE